MDKIFLTVFLVLALFPFNAKGDDYVREEEEAEMRNYIPNEEVIVGSNNVSIIEEEMIYIPGGEFVFGSNKTTIASYPMLPFLPEKKVYLKGFYIGKFEVTNAQYKVFIDKGGYQESKYWTKDGWDFITENQITKPRYWDTGQHNSGIKYLNYPVVGVNWYEVSAYAKWAGKRLPTEMEWEKAARGEDGRLYPWGNTFDSKYCNSAETDLEQSLPVGSLLSGVSPYGVMDMCGNVREWVGEDPFIVSDSKHGLLRGTAWEYKAETYGNNTVRYYYSIKGRGEGIYTGFRLAKDE